MKLRLKKSTTVISSCLTALAIFVVSGFMFASATKPATAQSEGGRLITVHDRGVETAFVTTKETLREAFADHGIHLDGKDAVEPSADEKLVAPDYQVNIYRARPVTVIDGATRQRVVTPYQSAERIAKDAGVTLFAEDTTSLKRSADIIGDGAGLQLTIDRATPIILDLYGKKTEVRTQGETVGAMLKEKDIALGANGRASLSMETPITQGMEVRVWREGKQTVTVDEDVAFETEQIKDADRPMGYKEVQTPGKTGKRTVTYEIEIQNGTEVARQEIASIVITPAEKQVEVIGTYLPTPTNPSENQIVGKEMMLAAGFGESQWPCLYNLWMRESGWRVNAGNPTSGAYGIPQSLPASKMATFGDDYRTNARTQIAWGLSYVKGRYGTPCNAYQHWQDYNWY